MHGRHAARGGRRTHTPPTTMSLSPTATDTPPPAPPPASGPAPVTTPASAATLVVSPPRGAYRQTITLTGTNFESSEPVSIYRDSTDFPRHYVATTTPTGSFVLRRSVRQGTYGAHTLIAVGQASGMTAIASFAVTPAADLARTSGPQGALNALTGTGFAAHETVVAYWTVEGPLVGRATTDARGTFAGAAAITFATPPSPVGFHELCMVGQTSGAIAYSLFCLLPMLALAPLGGRRGSTVRVWGTGYGAHEAVIVRWDSTTSTCAGTRLLGVALTDANGNFRDLRVTIPTDGDTGWHMIRAQGRTTSAIATTCYNVIPGRMIHDAPQEELAWGDGRMSDAGW